MALIVLYLFIFTTNPDKVVDHTNFIQRFLTKGAGKVVKLPSGTFNVTTLTVPKLTHLTIGATTTLVGLPTEKSLAILNLETGVKLEGTGVINGNRKLRTRGTAITINSAKNVLVRGLRIKEVAEQGIQVIGSNKVHLDKLQIVGCGAKGVAQYQGINLVISQNIQVTGCRVESAMHGIQWWGDDTNGYCENLRISGNRVRRVTGGIWGNKGRNVTVTNNTTEICSDVGIDFEHSFNCSASRNLIRDCKNYGLATFYGSEKITFSNNRVYQGATFGHGIGLCGDGTSRKISFLGGSINTKGPNACGLLTVGTNVAEDVLLQGFRIVTEGKNGIPIRVLDNNNFKIINNPLISGAGPVGVSLEGSSRSLVAGNTIVHHGIDTSPVGYRGGVFVYFRSSNYPAHNNRIQRNIIRGYKTGINDDCWGDVNSNNIFEHNTTPNIVHRASAGIWGGKALQNTTGTKAMAPIRINP